MALAAVVDVRYCTPQTKFQIKEIQLGFPADLGVLQRLPHLMGHDSFLREIALTGRVFSGIEAVRSGFCQFIPSFENMTGKDDKTPTIEETLHKATVEHCLALAKQIAEMNPLAVQGTKLNLNFVRPKMIDSGLNLASTFNMIALKNPLLADTVKSALSLLDKQK
ncbi:unnamed protein product [Gordionus sp. m RMFG-2023]